MFMTMPSKTVSALKFRQHLAELLDSVRFSGSELSITRHGKVIAKLVPADVKPLSVASTPEIEAGK